ncbi:hypothetical protein DH2020_021192 [Rehmannia glutinosa]|uniref:HMA domain-containing protein n=1 Tax=Rehmannia glutinosa TaxID=99300 RepID=A0ABR0WDJ1_REHGL
MADLHCDGCASKVIKCIRSIDGVDAVTTGDGHKITVVGTVDPVKLREKVEQKTHKKVELISPQPKKDGDNKENAKGKENNGKQEKKKETQDKNSNDKSDQKKSKEKERTLVCRRYQEMKIDKQKDLVTVTGAMDMKALAENLQKQLKKGVEIVPPKKDGEKKEKGGGGDKGNSGGEAGGFDGGDGKMEANKMQAQLGAFPYPFTPGPVIVGDQFHYNPYPVYHAPQLFSDENPNACSVM